MRNSKYTEEEKDVFIALAQEMGIGPAIRQTEGRKPSYPTLQKWFVERNLPIPTIDSLQARAAEMRYFYDDREKKYAAQRNMEAIVESLETQRHDADGLNKLTNALHTAIKTFNLIEGKATVVQETHTKDATDLAIADLLNRTKAENALREAEISE